MRAVRPSLNRDARGQGLVLPAFLVVLVLPAVALLSAQTEKITATPSTNSAHWSFQPLVRPQIPLSLSTAWTNAIDAFVVATLKKQKLSVSSEADRRTLIRRVYFDLTGLPPSPEEAEAFQNDKRPDAYEKIVERLLASPRYGERWARHWLDVVRFAETHGFEMNQPRPNAWPYRDYVIRAFNEDKPYDRFILEQLAGDALGADEATGFIVGGPWDEVKSPDVVLTTNQRADEMHDMVSTTTSAFVGLTVGCARCHDHKFDPIPQTDYFAIKACFAGVQHGERKLQTPDAEAKNRELDQARKWLAKIEAQLQEFEPLASTTPPETNRRRAAVHPRRNVERLTPTLAKRLKFTINATTDAEPCLDELEVFTAGADSTNIALVSAGTKATASSVFPNSDLHRLEHINDGKYGNSRSWISNERGKGWVELEFAGPATIDRIIWGRDREEKYSDRLAIDYRIEVAANSNDWKMVASSADRRPYSASTKDRPPASPDPNPERAKRHEQLAEEKQTIETRIRELSRRPMVYGGTFTKPEPTHRFHRGDPMQQREVVESGTLTYIGARTAMSARIPGADHESGSRTNSLSEETHRRLALAKWIVDPANPLTARVMANRIWQQHFGEGLVSTPSDFGLNGARPSHPELLDWLAAEFIASGWSVKHLHRLIVTSATYRQSGAPRKDALALDAGGRLLWRFPPRRLEAEAIRDAILAVSGKLDLRMGGPGFSFFEANDNYVRVYEPRKEFGPDTWRRMIYGTIVRQRPDGVFGVFDCPDAGQITPKRTRSTTPLQALNLLNSSFIVQQAGFFAERLEREAGRRPHEQVRRAFALAYGRAPSRGELASALELVRQEGLPALCRALFNANEFVFLL
jgi:hypothetical protein